MRKKLIISIVLVLVVVAGLLYCSGLGNTIMGVIGWGEIENAEDVVIVLDAGHGGMDPGKVGIHDEKEKDINLSIIYKLKELLEENDVKIILTREGDDGLYTQEDKNKKKADLNKRLDIIDNSGALLVVSIHQNAYPSQDVHGAQVFYQEKSPVGRQLAQCVQTELINGLDKENTRQIKGNGSYYLLKKSQIPMIIVECGFLSNDEEAKKLKDEAYQESLAEGIAQGILTYLDTNSKK